MRTDAEAAEDALADRVYAVLPLLHISVFGFSALPNALAEYVPSIPPRFLYREALSTRALRAQAFVHELCHVFLHPPGSAEDTAEHESVDEERAVHEAAAHICLAFEVDGYRRLMEGNGVQIAAPEPEDSELIERLVVEVSAVLKDPIVASSW